MNRLKLFESFDEEDLETMGRHELHGSNAQVAFNFNNMLVYDTNEIVDLISKFNQFYVEDGNWVGGPTNRRFIDYFSKKYGVRVSGKAYWPCISLVIQSHDCGDHSLGFSIRTKKCIVSISPLNNETSITGQKVWRNPGTIDQSQIRTLVGISNYANKKIFREDLTIQETIELLNLKVDNMVEWEWTLHRPQIRKEKLSESVDLTIQDVDKYRPMFRLMADLLDLHCDPNYKASDNTDPYNFIYDILLEFESCFNTSHIRIGDKKYSLTAEGDNELNKLKELRRVHIGYGEDVRFNPDLYFEDIKMIDWMLYQVEDGNYHIVVDSSYVEWVHSGDFRDKKNRRTGRSIGQVSRNIADKVHSRFRKNLENLEIFYTKFGKLNTPKFTIEDVEDILLEFLDSRQISAAFSQDIMGVEYVFNSLPQDGTNHSFSDLSRVPSGNTLFYNIIVRINLPDIVKLLNISDRSNFISEINKSVKRRLERNFEIVHVVMDSGPFLDDNYSWGIGVCYKSIEK